MLLADARLLVLASHLRRLREDVQGAAASYGTLSVAAVFRDDDCACDCQSTQQGGGQAAHVADVCA